MDLWIYPLDDEVSLLICLSIQPPGSYAMVCLTVVVVLYYEHIWMWCIYVAQYIDLDSRDTTTKWD